MSEHEQSVPTVRPELIAEDLGVIAGLEGPMDEDLNTPVNF